MALSSIAGLESCRFPPPMALMTRPPYSGDRSFVEKMAEFLVGDGPSNRMALICEHCKGHNGMALQEEFPYMSFNCCYCTKFNPSRRQRPVAPRLPSSHVLPLQPTDELKAIAPPPSNETKTEEAETDQDQEKPAIESKCPDEELLKLNEEMFELVKEASEMIEDIVQDMNKDGMIDAILSTPDTGLPVKSVSEGDEADNTGNPDS